MARAEITVIGLRELRRDLKALDNEGGYKPRLREAGLRVARIVADEARANARRGATTLAGTRATMGSVAIESIRPLAGQARATVAGGRKSLPYYTGWEFGSAGRNRSISARYPAVVSKRGEVLAAYRMEIERLLNDYNL